MKAMWEETVRAAEEQNFQRIAATASSGQVRGVLEDNLGFWPVSEVSFDEFKFQGQHIFKEITERDPEHARLLMLERKVNSNMY